MIRRDEKGKPYIQLGFSKNVLPAKQLSLRKIGFVPKYNMNIVRGSAEIERCLSLAKDGKIRGGRRK